MQQPGIGTSGCTYLQQHGSRAARCNLQCLVNPPSAAGPSASGRPGESLQVLHKQAVGMGVVRDAAVLLGMQALAAGTLACLAGHEALRCGQGGPGQQPLPI